MRISAAFIAIQFAIDLVELQMTSCASFMHKMYAQINMLGTLIPTNRAFRPSDARLIVRKHRSWGSLRKAKITEKFAKINHLLNHSRGRDEFRFGCHGR